MNQTSLWHDTIFDALGTTVQSAGGVKRVATKLWPTLDPSLAATRLRNSLNPEHAQKLDPTELQAVARLGKDVGDHSVMVFLARDLGYEIKPLSSEESKAHAIRAEKLALLERLRQLETVGQ